MKDPDPPTDEIQMHAITKHKVTFIKLRLQYLESISCCETGSTTSGPDRWFEFRVLLAACPSVPLSTSLISKVFLLAMMAFLCQGYSGLTGTSWCVSKARRHVDNGFHILMAEKLMEYLVGVNFKGNQLALT